MGNHKAVKVRGQAVNEIRAVCSLSSFGLLCPIEKEKELDEAIAKANEYIKVYNDGSVHSRVSIYILKGKISNTDVEAVRALSSEVSSLIAEMENGITRLNATDIRVAANRAKQIVGTLGDEQAALLNSAIAEARTAARAFVKRIEKKGESAEVVLAEIRRNELEKARVTFLDYSESVPESEENLPAVQQQRFADLDVSEVKEEPEGEDNAV